LGTIQKKANKMPVMEIFGPTIQGEGMVIGRKTMFVRTGGCDYSCAWCDSAFTWNGEQKADMMTAQKVFAKLHEIGEIKEEGRGDFMSDAQPIVSTRRNFNHVTISGGNPALIRGAMTEFIDMCHANGIEVGLETQGSRWQDWFLEIDDLTISPKPPSSTMTTDWEKLDDIIMKLEEGLVNYTLKVVIFDEVDLEYAKKVYNRYKHNQKVFYVSLGNEDPYENGDISGRLLSELDTLWNMVLRDPDCNDWRPLPQLHTLVWANKRGV
jgi:7-carboxy-7-deazaguanine synthase